MSQAQLSETPTIHPEAEVANDVKLGVWTEVGRRTQIRSSEFGDYSYITEDGNVIWTTIGKFCSIANGVRLNPGNHPSWRACQHHAIYRAAAYDLGEDDEEFFRWRKQNWVTIGHDVWIGHGVTVTAGAHIGTGAVIGAGAVVTKDIAPYTVVGGVPAKTIKRRFTETQGESLISIGWWDWDHATLKARLADFRKFSIDEFIERYS